MAAILLILRVGDGIFNRDQMQQRSLIALLGVSLQLYQV